MADNSTLTAFCDDCLSNWGADLCDTQGNITCTCHYGFTGDSCKSSLIEGHKVGWDVMCYVLGVLSALVFVIGAIQLVFEIVQRGKSSFKGSRLYCFFFLSMASLTCALYLLGDPYGYRQAIRPANAWNYVFGIINLPLITTALSISTFHWAVLVQGSQKLHLMNAPVALVVFIVINALVYLLFIVFVILGQVIDDFRLGPSIIATACIVMIFGLSVALIVFGVKIRKVLRSFETDSKPKRETQLRKLTVFLIGIGCLAIVFVIEVLIKYISRSTNPALFIVGFALNYILIEGVIALQLAVLWQIPAKLRATMSSPAQNTSNSEELSSSAVAAENINNSESGSRMSVELQ